ncbi:Cna B-type domain-containing protein [Arcanobacterium buesumense]|uniref:Cna B-type domain-containing protein n=1 Tax=Arcanobacterium buesumense TaxID=2722751 RepID=A0A6H2EK11_9ACTO|nr:Cna B-type domain-containing protein [Arcanobacterium buesumense]QJC21484.1 Cna B-type domain-containing protein [Arcanobacterium buesumense]
MTVRNRGLSSCKWFYLFVVLVVTSLVTLSVTPVLQAHAADRQEYICEFECDIQAFIDEAGTNPARIVLYDGDNMVTSTIIINPGQDIEMVEGEPFSPMVYSDGSLLNREDGFARSLIHVKEGGKLTLQANPSGKTASNIGVYARGEYVSASSPTILVEGQLVLGKGSKVYGARNLSGVYQGAITVTGKNASLMIDGGTVTDNWRAQDPSSTQYGAGNIAVTKGARLIMNSGLVSDGHGSAVSGASYGETGGIGVYNGGYAEINGGEVTNNEGFGGGIVAWTWPQNRTATLRDPEGERSNVVINGGTISKNRAGFGGGGALVFGNATLVMNGGEITENTAPNGGGVNTMDLYVWGADYTWQEIDGEGPAQGFTAEEWKELVPGSFTMNGGTIAKNEASRTGGGVNVISNTVDLRGGEILDNTAEGQGGGVYVATKTYTARILNALITDNTSSAIGGGVWTCPTGSVTFYVTDGVAVANNSAKKFGDDLAHLNYGGAHAAPIRLSERMLGGGISQWYDDGSLATGTTRFDPDNTGDLRTPEEVFELSNAGIKNVSPQESLEIAKKFAQLTISGNAAPLGGGVGTNGHVVFGTPEQTSIQIEKVWIVDGVDVTDSGEDLTDGYAGNPVHVDVLRKDYSAQSGQVEETIVDTIELSWNAGWKTRIDNLPRNNADGDPIEYGVHEHDVEGFTSTAMVERQWDGSWLVKLTNTKDEPTVTSLRLAKKWTPGAPSNVESLSFDVIGTSDDFPDGRVIHTVDVTAPNWTTTVTDLPIKTDAGHDISYSVREHDVPGYVSVVSSKKNDDGTWVVDVENTVKTYDLRWSKTGEDGELLGGGVFQVTGPDGFELLVKDDSDADLDKKPGVFQISIPVAGEYTLVEVQAPAGYELDASPRTIRVDEPTSVTAPHTSGVFGAIVNKLLRTDITVEKHWVGEGQKVDVQFQLLSAIAGEDPQPVGDPVMLAAGATSYTWTSLPMFCDGKKLTYSVRELTVSDNFTSTVDGFVVTNTFTPPTPIPPMPPTPQIPELSKTGIDVSALGLVSLLLLIGGGMVLRRHRKTGACGELR